MLPAGEESELPCLLVPAIDLPAIVVVGVSRVLRFGVSRIALSCGGFRHGLYRFYGLCRVWGLPYRYLLPVSGSIRFPGTFSLLNLLGLLYLDCLILPGICRALLFPDLEPDSF